MLTFLTTKKEKNKMKKINQLLTALTFLVFSVASCHLGNSEKSKIVTQGNVTISDTIPKKWKIYINDEFGFKFQHPATWAKNEQYLRALNLSGEVTSVEVDFTDNISNTSFLVTYYLAPKGADIYQFAISQCNTSTGLGASDCKKIKVAGNEAIEASTIINKDGKGNDLKIPTKKIVIDFLDKDKLGAFELQLRTPLSNDLEVANFSQLLSTFAFTK